MKTVGNQTAYGLYGNGTDLTSTVRVLVGDSISLSGKWFSSGLVYVRWDGFNVVGTVTSDQWLSANIIGSTATGVNGTFSTSVTIPKCNAGAHFLAVEDSQARVIVEIFVSSATLQLVPPSGPGGAYVQFTGSGYPASTQVTLSYQDPTYGTWNAWASTTSDVNGNIAFSCQMPDLKQGSYNGDNLNATATYSTISFRSDVYNVSYGYVNYYEYYRGLTQIGNTVATGIFGNGTDLSSSVSPRPGDSLTISGKWFYPGIVYIRFDGTAVVGTVTADQWKSAQILSSTTASATTGALSTTVTIPTASGGSHFIAIDDSQTLMIYIINVIAAVIPTPSSTPTPVPTTVPTSTPTPTPLPASTPTPTTGPTSTPTQTNAPTSTPTPTTLPNSTPTPTAVQTSTPTPTTGPTSTPPPTTMPTSTPTSTTNQSGGNVPSQSWEIYAILGIIIIVIAVPIAVFTLKRNHSKAK